MTWCREFRAEFKHPSIKFEKVWDLDLHEHRLDRCWTDASFTKSFLLSGDGKFECETPGRVGPTSQSLSEPCCCSYFSISSINAQVASYTAGKKKKKKELSQFTLKFEKHLSL